MNKEKNTDGKKEKYFQITIAIIPFVISLVSIVISIITVVITIKESKLNELILQPRFSLEKNEDTNESDSFVWKISNLGGSISNATIYPTMYVTFSSLSGDNNKNVDITLQFIDYYSDNFYYKNSDGTFYVKDDKESKLNDFIDEYTNMITSDASIIVGYEIIPCFTLHYNDYKGEAYNDTYTIVDDDLFVDDSERKVFGDTMKLLEEISELPTPDIVLPLDSSSESVVSVNYKNAETQKIIYNEQEYDSYLHAVILDLINSKNKPIDEMFGSVILSNNQLWIRDEETGELMLVWMDE